MNLRKIYKAYSFKNLDSEAEGLVTLSQEQIDSLHKILLKIVDDIMDLCKERGYICYLGGGSALGAIRHSGFIPWDDDVDLNITREDYKKFIPEFRNKYGDKYWVHTPEENPKYGMPVCRIRMKGTLVITKEDLIDKNEAGAYVDIFIIENTYNNKIIRFFHGLLCIIAKACLSCRRFYRDYKILKGTIKGDSDSRCLTNSRLVIGFLCSFMSVERWTKVSNAIFSMCRDNTSHLVSIPTGRWHFFGEIAEREDFCSTKLIKFEGRDYLICNGIEKYMERIYGNNYMDIPPVEKREKHVCWGFDLGS